MEYTSYNCMDVTAGITFNRIKGTPAFETESDLYHHICGLLADAGYDVVVGYPDQDGHLTSAPFYITARDRSWCLFDELHQIRDLAEDYNKGQVLILSYRGE